MISGCFANGQNCDPRSVNGQAHDPHFANSPSSNPRFANGIFSDLHFANGPSFNHRFANGLSSDSRFRMVVFQIHVLQIFFRPIQVVRTVAP
jgi:hypothetical protein